MLSTFIIALREGLEASLIVGILVAYIIKTDRRSLLKPLWLGVAGAVIASLGLGALLSFTSAELTPRQNQLFAGTTSLIAVALVTWMVFWMKRTARFLKTELHGKVDNALTAGPLTLAGVAFFAVIREGLETALFIYANFRTVSGTTSAAVGLVFGFGISITLGWAIFKSAIKMNLSKFFKYTGVGLIVVAAGVLAYGIHEFQELGWLPGPDAFAWDTTSWMTKNSIAGAVLGGTVGFDTTTSWFQFGAWALYLIAVLTPYLRAPRAKVTLS